MRKLVQHRDKKFEWMSFHRLFILVCLFSMVSPPSTVFAQPSVDRSLVRLESPARPAKTYDSQEVTVPLRAPSLIPGSSKLPEGFELQVAASEPDVQQPIAMAWDAKGRLWVAENYTFAEGKHLFDTTLSDRILVLEDTDGNGTFDSRKVFWDEGKKLTGIEVGYRGIWALAPPNLLFLKDEDEDDVCDGRPQVVLNGFNEQMRYDMAHGLRFGPDGWLYGMHGASAISMVGVPIPSDAQQQSGLVQRFLVHEEQPRLFSPLRVKTTYERAPVQGGIWRFNVNTSDFQVYCSTSKSPSGMDWDRFGNLFIVSNDSNDVWHALPNSHRQLLFEQDADPSTQHFLPKLGSNGNANESSGEIQNNGALIYQSDQWPKEFQNQLLVLSNHEDSLIRRELVRRGANFFGDKEATLAKMQDPWFRGLDINTGPDGSVTILDWSELGDSRDDDGVHRHSGRIYRIRYQSGNTGSSPKADVSALPFEDLAKCLQQSNSWDARMSQRLLASARRLTLPQVQTIRKWIFTKSFPSASVDPTLVRIRALWLIQEAGNLDSRTVVQLLRSNPPDELAAAAIRLIADDGIGSELPEDTEVYEEILDSLGTLVSSKSGPLTKLYLAALQPRLSPNDWRLPTLLSQSVELENSPDFTTVMWHGIKNRVVKDPMGAAKLCGKCKMPKLVKLIVRKLAMLHNSDPEAIAWVIGDATIRGSKEHIAAVVDGMVEGYSSFRLVEAPKAWEQLRSKIQSGANETTRVQANVLQKIFGAGLELDYLIRVANDPNADMESRRYAIQSIANQGTEEALVELWKLFENEELVGDVSKAIATTCTPADAVRFVEAYPRVGPFAKAGLVDALASQPKLLGILLEAIESNKIPTESIDATSWHQFRFAANWSWLERARKLNPIVLGLTADQIKDIALMERELSKSNLGTGDAGRGRVVWEKTCASCHTLFDSGGDIGPDLTNSPRSNLSYWLENVIVPYEQVALNYRISIFQNQEGAIVPGILLAENKETITIQTATEKWIAKPHEILQRTPSSHSLMPEGLLDNMKSNSRIDLFCYLMSEQQVPIPQNTKKNKAR